MSISTQTASSRSLNIKHHIKFSFIYKILAIAFNFLLVPITLNYLGGEKYGIWLTILSILSWITFFDIGFGNGMRTKVAEALALGKTNLVKSYISTTYAVIGLVVALMFILVLIITSLLNWNSIFNSHLLDNTDLKLLMIITAFFILSNFVLSLINQIVTAYQQTSISTLNQVLSNGAALGITYLLSISTSNSIIYLAIGYGSSLLLSNIFISYLFFRRHNETVPSLKHVDFKHIPILGGLGLQFFIVQIAVLIIFTTDNIIITQIFGPEYVTTYNIVLKFFSIVAIAHSTLLGPFLSAYTEAFAKNDILWISIMIKKLNLLMLPIIITIIIMAVFAKPLIALWIGKTLEIETLLIILMAVYTIISIWNNIYAFFVNGIGRVKLQMYSAIVAGVINIPLSIFFAKTVGLGTSGVILGTIISLSLFAVLGPIQTYFILKGNQ